MTLLHRLRRTAGLLICLLEGSADCAAALRGKLRNELHCYVLYTLQLSSRIRPANMRDPRDDGMGVFQGTAAGLCIGVGAWSLGRSLRDVRPANSYSCLSAMVCCDTILRDTMHCPQMA